MKYIKGLELYNNKTINDDYVGNVLQKTFESFKAIIYNNDDKYRFFEFDIFLNENDFIKSQYMVSTENRYAIRYRYLDNKSNYTKKSDIITADIVKSMHYYINNLSTGLNLEEYPTIDLLRFIFSSTRTYLPLSTEHIAIHYITKKLIDGVNNIDNYCNAVIKNVLLIKTVLYKLKYLDYNIFTDDADYDNVDNIKKEIDLVVYNYSKIKDNIDLIITFLSEKEIHPDDVKVVYDTVLNHIVFSYVSMLSDEYPIDVFLNKMYRYAVDNSYEFVDFLTGMTNFVRDLLCNDVVEQK